MNTNPLQQENPGSVCQRIGGHLKIHSPMTEVRRKNRPVTRQPVLFRD